MELAEHPLQTVGDRIVVITGSRASGKSTAAVEWLQEATAEQPRILVVTHFQQREMLRKMLGGTLPEHAEIIPVQRFVSFHPQPETLVGVDEAGRVLSYLLNAHVSMMTVSVD